MTPRLPFRPVLLVLAGVSLSACGVVQDDPMTFQSMAETVAAIPLDGAPPARTAHPRTSREAGLRPAVEVEVMSPHALWDAREGDAARPATPAGERLIEAATPAAAKAVFDRTSAEIRRTGDTVLRAAVHRQEPPIIRTESASLVQLGAYGGEASARAAWARLKSGPAAWALDGLSPVYEPAEVNGRRVVRLKTRAPGAGAAALCAAAGIDDPWCHQAAR